METREFIKCINTPEVWIFSHFVLKLWKQTTNVVIAQNNMMQYYKIKENYKGIKAIQKMNTKEKFLERNERRQEVVDWHVLSYFKLFLMALPCLVRLYLLANWRVIIKLFHCVFCLLCSFWYLKKIIRFLCLLFLTAPGLPRSNLKKIPLKDFQNGHIHIKVYQLRFNGHKNPSFP